MKILAGMFVIGIALITIPLLVASVVVSLVGFLNRRVTRLFR